MKNSLDSSRLRCSLALCPNPEVVAERAGDAILLIHLETNRIYELNQTAARLWEIINDNGAPADMLAEFDVAEDQLSKEIESLVSMLKKEDLVIEQDQH